MNFGLLIVGSGFLLADNGFLLEDSRILHMTTQNLFHHTHIALELGHAELLK